MLIVAPSGNTNDETSSATPTFFSTTSMVTGSVAPLDEVEKALMAPAVIGSRGSREVQERVADLAREWNGFAAKAKAHVEATCENVGDRFPEEARKQHYGEAEAKPIYGQATRKEAEALKEEGVAITPVPEPLPEPGQVKKKLN